MTGIPLQFSILNSNSIKMKKKKQQASKNLFNNHQRNPPISSDATLPMITLSSFSSFKKKFIQMATNKKSTIPPNNIPADFRMTHIKSHTRSLHRQNISSIPKSSLSYPIISHRLTSASTRTKNSTPSPSPQQQLTIPPRPYNQYGHFLACLRRQSLARMRRKQEEEEGHTDHIETTITLNLIKQPSPQLFSSASHYSLNSLSTDTTPIPMISIKAKRTKKLPSSFHPVQRLTKTYHQQSPALLSKSSIDSQLFPLPSSSYLMTPRNSLVDESTMSPRMNPYELHLNNDMLKYCYVSSENGIEYQGQILPAAV